MGAGRRKATEEAWGGEEDPQPLTNCELPGAEGGVFSFLPPLSTEMSAR